MPRCSPPRLLPLPAAPAVFSLPTALIPLDEVRAEWEKTSGPFHKQRLAEYYGIFRDLFQKGTFTPWVSLRVEYSQEDEHLVPVYYGNMVTPTEVCEQPWPRGEPVSFCQVLLVGVVHSGGFFYGGISSGVKEIRFLGGIRTEVCDEISLWAG